MPDFLVDVILQPTGPGQTSGAPIQVITPTGSPFPYAATSEGSLSVQGGTVTIVQFTRGSTIIPLGLTSALIPMVIGDKVTITYLSAPSIYFIPR